MSPCSFVLLNHLKRQSSYSPFSRRTSSSIHAILQPLLSHVTSHGMLYSFISLIPHPPHPLITKASSLFSIAHSKILLEYITYLLMLARQMWMMLLDLFSILSILVHNECWGDVLLECYNSLWFASYIL